MGNYLHQLSPVLIGYCSKERKEDNIHETAPVALAVAHVAVIIKSLSQNPHGERSLYRKLLSNYLTQVFSSYVEIWLWW